MNEKPMILVVDDEPANVFFFKGILEKEGYRVVTASTGAEALTKIKEEPPALILMDLLLPRLHGFDLLQKLKEDSLYRDIPVVIATAVYKGSIHKLEAKRLGAAEFLEKPVDPDVLLETIRKVFMAVSHDGPPSPVEE